MNHKTQKSRRKRKKTQLTQRAMIRIIVFSLTFLLGTIFLIRGIIFPLISLVKEGGSGAEQIQISSNRDPEAALRIPLRSSADMAKLTSFSPGWHTSDAGTWYQNFDGTYYADGFQAIDNQQYYFTEDGYLATGWVTSGAKEYYFNEEGQYEPDKIRPRLALTFDDGPGQYTDRLLDCLEQNGAHATFFMVGQNVGLYPETVQRMVNIGCELGNHTWDHANLPTLTEEQVENEFNLTDQALLSACGRASSVIRPPYGASNSTVVSLGGKPSILWCVDSLDWSNLDAQLDYQVIMDPENLTDGSIILMHDIHEPTITCAERIIPELTQKGYRLLTVSELAQSNNVDLQVASYTDFWSNSLKAGRVAGYVDDTLNVSVADQEPVSSESSPVVESYPDPQTTTEEVSFTAEEGGEALTAFSNNVFGGVTLY